MSNKLLIGNLPLTVSETALANFFASAGTVIAVNISTNDAGRPCGFAFVEMEHCSDIERVVSQLQLTKFEGRSISITVMDQNQKSKGTILSNLFRFFRTA